MRAAIVAISASLVLGMVVLSVAPRLSTGAAAPAVSSTCLPGSAPAEDGRLAPGEARVTPAAYLDAKRQRIVVDVYAHVLRTRTHGGVPLARIVRSIKILNHAFAGHQSSLAADSPFRFRLVDSDVTVNAAWARMNEGSLAESRAKRALHRGGSADLNLYIGANSAGQLGWGTQPTRYAGQPLLDGVVIARHTMAGGEGGRYSSGDAAVHETGHWLGLSHTFTGRCSKRGDLVADTPAEARPSYDCHPHRNTCSAPGNDPVHNFMDYGTDACMNQFTPGQVERMLGSWDRLRASGRRTSA